MHEELKAQGVRVSRKRVIRLMQEQGLKGKTRRRWVKTTHSKHELPVAPNLLDRNFEASRPNPWRPQTRTHNLAQIAERYGGGGHPVVGAASFSAAELDRARKAAAEIVAELRGG